MLHQQDHFESHDGLRLYRQCWLPERESTAVVVLVHGFTEHGGRYAAVAAELCRHGYAVYALDLRGHGRSEGERVFVRCFDEFLDDLEIFVRWVRQCEPGKGLFLLGYSMGGTIAARFVVTRHADFRGLVLAAPAAQVGRGVFPLLRRLASVVSRICPRLKIVRLGSAWVSRDAEVVAEFRSDPLVFHGRFPVRIGAEILRTGAEMLDQASAIRLPLLVLQGTGDRVVDPGGARRLCTRAASEDKTLQLYEGIYHDLLHEPEKDQVIADLIAWLDHRLATR
ncbi:MAG: hypothetical protein A2V70_12805 [Planctomycetes bacterium RBG_13_63_9]|nr:MAG: hypothetical protein A2V70_12805 [Planctomycetes bacterium RBG_13_63_9]